MIQPERKPDRTLLLYHHWDLVARQGLSVYQVFSLEPPKRFLPYPKHSHFETVRPTVRRRSQLLSPVVCASPML